MKILVAFSFVFAVASAQFFPGFPFPGFPFPGYFGEDQYAASLGGAPVGLYSKTHPGGPFGGPYGNLGSDISSASLGGAKVGLYGKEHPQQGFPVSAPVPLAQPIRPLVQPVRPLAQPIRPVVQRPVKSPITPRVFF